MVRVFSSDETGLVKEVRVAGPGLASTVQRWGEQERERGVQAMAFTDSAARSELLLGLESGDLWRLDPETGELAQEVAACSAQFKGLDLRDGHIVTCDEAGRVRYRKRGVQGAAAVTVDFTASQHANRLRVSAIDAHKIAVGGKDADLRVWDVKHTQKPLFKAKNVKNDFLNLQVPINVTDLQFVPGSGDTQLVVSSAERHIRLYDTKVKGRPIFTTELTETAIKTMAISSDGWTVIVGDTQGTLVKADLRQNGAELGRFKGMAGGVRAIDLHPTLPIMGACGLDRFVRLYDLESRRCISKTYAKQRQTCLLFANDEWPKEEEQAGDGKASKGKRAAAADGEDEEEEDDELVWDKLAPADEDGDAGSAAAAAAAAAAAVKASSKKASKPRKRARADPSKSS